MKAMFRLCCIGLLLLCGCQTAMAQAQSYDSLWKQVEQAQRKNLPQTVIKLTGQIVQKAENEKNAPQLLKAYLCRNAYQERLTPDSLYTNLNNLEQWAATEKQPANRAILHSILAEQYADYVSRNRRTLLQRTALDTDNPPADIREWSFNLFAGRIDRHALASLQPTDVLTATGTDAYVPFVEQETGSRFYGHDLYHLLVRRAVEIYSSAYAVASDDSLSRQRIQTIYRRAIETYRQRPDKADAVVLCTVEFLNWQYYNDRTAMLKARSSQQKPPYILALDTLIATYGDREVCAEAYLCKAQRLSSGPYIHMAEALAACDEGIRRYPKYARINELKTLRDDLLRPQLNIVVGPSAPPYPGDTAMLQVFYKQVEGFTLNLYATTFKELPQAYNINAETYRKHARKLSSTHYDLIPLPDGQKRPDDVPYLQSDTVLRLPLPTTTGVFILQAIPDGKREYRPSDQLLSLSRLKVLSIDLGEGKQEFTAVDAKSGHPVEGVTIRFFSTWPGNRNPQMVTELTTDTGGKAVLSANKTTDIHSYTAFKGDDTAMPLQTIYLSSPTSAVADSLTTPHTVTLLTDRAIYRPGQTVYVKGVVYSLEAGDKARVVPDATYELTLLDANRQNIGTQQVRTNAFGSFAADFVLPTSCLNGSFAIETSNGQGRTTFRVEEYKRPTFELSFTPVQEAYRLGDTVRLHGNVKAFSGRTVQHMPLAYTVRRRNMLRSYWRPDDQPLLSDTVMLDADGNFCIPLRLEGETEGIDNRLNPYAFDIEATVTDESGETQTASYHLTAGDRAYTISAPLPMTLCKEDSLNCTFRVTNANGIPQNTDSRYLLYREGHDRPVLEARFTPNRVTDLSAWRRLPSGQYRLEIVVRDSLGREERRGTEGETTFQLFSTNDRRPADFTDLFYYCADTDFGTDRPATIFFGTSHREAYVLLDMYTDRRIESRVLQLNDSITRLDIPYREAYGDGLSLLFRFVKNGKTFTQQVCLQKRQPERRLDIRWEVFRDRLLPGQEETWKLIVKTPQGGPAAAEMLATMYDASLDKLYRRNQSLEVFFPRRQWPVSYRESSPRYISLYLHFLTPDYARKVWLFDHFMQPPYLHINAVSGVDIALHSTEEVTLSIADTRSNAAAPVAVTPLAKVEQEEAAVLSEGSARLSEPPVSGSDLTLRTNFAETAFFFPQLQTNAQGEIVCTFTVPQSLTRWNFLGYAHTRDMMTGRIEASTVTAKDFMLTPNLPRFVRVGDKTQVTATIANLTAEALKGTARLELFDPSTEKVIASRKQKFTAEAGANAAVCFDFTADERYDLLGVRLTAEAGRFSDGEQHLLPVLSDKVYLTETQPLPIRGQQTRTFGLDSLFNRDSRTATHRRLTVEFTGNPAWYAVQALPALSDPTTDNATDWATAYYANTLAAHIANSQPRIKAMFDQWQASETGREALHSRLQQNEELKSILLSESPWLMEARTTAEQQARIATLFDVNRQAGRTASTLARLKALQNADGAWSWFKGMPGSRQMTDYITTLLVRLPLLTGQPLPAEAREMKQRAFDFLHREARTEYEQLLEAERRGATISQLSGEALNYLYLTALDKTPVPEANKAAWQYFFARLGNELTTGDMARLAKAAIVFHQTGHRREADDFMAALREHLIREDELGAHFAFNDTPYDWATLPVPTHVAAMEAFQQTGADPQLTEEMKLWLLKQKQTNSWDSPVATANAIYALLCRGDDLLANRGDVRLTLGQTTLSTLPETGDAVPGLNYIKQTYTAGSRELEAKTITVTKADEGIAWGAVYAQYLSPIADVQAHGDALSVTKQLFVVRLDEKSRESLQPLAEAGRLAVGDRIVSRLTLRLDRAMDFLHLKDQRGACFEPLGSLSGYRRSNGFGYYLEVEDAATNFFFDHLGKGTYVLEYSYRIARQGTYQTGLATLQCAYAPEFSGHSAGGYVTVTE